MIVVGFLLVVLVLGVVAFRRGKGAAAPDTSGCSGQAPARPRRFGPGRRSGMDGWP